MLGGFRERERHSDRGSGFHRPAALPDHERPDFPALSRWQVKSSSSLSSEMGILRVIIDIRLFATHRASE